MLRKLVSVRSASLSTRRCFAEGASDSNQKLRNDIKSLGKTLGDAIKTEDEGVFRAVEKLRLLGREVCLILTNSQPKLMHSLFHRALISWLNIF